MTYGLCGCWQQQPALNPLSFITVRTAQQPFSYGSQRAVSHGYFLAVNGMNSDTPAPKFTPMHHRWSNPIKSRA
jgi:hypothetical protein